MAVCSLCSVASMVRRGSSDGFEKPRENKILDNELRASKVSMVPLTLIHGADSKGAGIHTHTLSLSFVVLIDGKRFGRTHQSPSVSVHF